MTSSYSDSLGNYDHKKSTFGQKMGFSSLRGWIFWRTLLYIFLILLFAFLVIIQNYQTQKINEQNVNIHAPITLIAKDILIDLGNTHHQLQRYVMDYGEDASFKQDNDKIWKEQINPAYDKLSQLKEKLPYPREKELIDSIQIYLTKYHANQAQLIQIYQQTMQIKSAKDTSVANTYYRQKTGLKVVTEYAAKDLLPTDTQLRQLLQALIQHEERTLTQNLNSLSNGLSNVNLSAIAISLIVLLISFVMGFAFFNFVKKSFQPSILALDKLAKGELPPQTPIQGNELDDLVIASNQLIDNLQKASQFALAIGESNFSANFEAVSEKDNLGDALLQMRNRLQVVANEDKKRNWATVGYAKFGDIIRQNNENVKQLTNQVLSELIEYLQLNQGGIFLVEFEDDTQYLDLIASYAYNRQKFLKKRIQIHEDYAETLVGQAFLEKDKIYLTDIPKNYLNITSGLGDAPPSNLLIAPLISNESVEGVMELASFRQLETYEIEFVEKIGENLASAINYVRINEQTRYLLLEYQQQREALMAQEEEMRQNMEELEATQETMRKAQLELMQNEANLSALINNTTDSIATLDHEYRVMIINRVLRNRYKGTNYEGIDTGVNLLDYYSGEIKEEWKSIYDRGLSGETFDFVLKSSVNNEDSYRHYFINPIKNNAGEIVGVSVFSRDITQQRIRQMQDEALINELKLKIVYYETQVKALTIDK